MISQKFEHIIADKIPANAISYLVSLFEVNPFNFKLSRDRRSKSGDYRYDKRNGSSTVTVNVGLNEFSFLITLVHEIAHHTTRLNYKNVARPHGQEWKSEFKRLMLPVLNPLVFPEDLLQLLARHLKNPKASTWSDSRLAIALHSYDASGMDENQKYLDEISSGETFIFNDREFKKLNKRRTRVLCQDCKTGRKYLIPKQAIVNTQSGS
jgi:hypothetical protein